MTARNETAHTPNSFQRPRRDVFKIVFYGDVSKTKNKNIYIHTRTYVLYITLYSL